MVGSGWAGISDIGQKEAKKLADGIGAVGVFYQNSVTPLLKMPLEMNPKALHKHEGGLNGCEWIMPADRSIA